MRKAPGGAVKIVVKTDKINNWVDRSTLVLELFKFKARLRAIGPSEVFIKII